MYLRGLARSCEASDYMVLFKTLPNFNEIRDNLELELIAYLEEKPECTFKFKEDKNYPMNQDLVKF